MAVGCNIKCRVSAKGFLKVMGSHVHCNNW